MNSTNRRDFLRSGGTALGAGVAVTTGLGATNAAQAERLPVSAAADREAIQRLHRDQLLSLEAQGGSVTYRPRLAGEADAVMLAADGRSAKAVFHVEAETVTPLEGDSTLVQMARMQGNVASRHVEAGWIESEYARQDGYWKLVAFQFRRS